MGTENGSAPRRHRPRRRNTRAKALLWSAVVGIAAVDDLASKLAII